MSNLTELQHDVYFSFCSPKLMCMTIVEAFTAIHKQYPEVKHCVRKKVSDTETQFIFVFKDGSDNLIITRKIEPCPELDIPVGDRVKLYDEELKNVLAEHDSPQR
ncbi:hypothetical protein [Pseudomonas phage U1B]|nr:hypothetical protein [Pseudomonas phage T2P]QYV99157.1 hypothetical protein [Pseudomonas phage U1B]QYV99612.1 hypothetical protein [Pseudomonas phage U5]